MLVSGSLSGSVTVAANAVLGGTGTIAPGASIGTLTVNAASTVAPALSLTSGATFSFELNTGVTSDRIAIINAAAVSVAFAGNTINFSDLSAGALSEGDYILFSADAPNAYTGLTTDGGGFITSGLVIGTGVEAYPLAALQVVGNNIVLTAIPEPGSAAMLLAGFSSLLGLKRFRRRA